MKNREGKNTQKIKSKKLYIKIIYIIKIIIFYNTKLSDVKNVFYFLMLHNKANCFKISVFRGVNKYHFNSINYKYEVQKNI